jgi:hypothetical protein
VDSALTYDELVGIARQDDNILGLALTVSRGKRFAVTDDSDWDVRLVVLHAERVQAWEQMIDDTIAQGHFLYSFTLFITARIRQ